MRPHRRQPTRLRCPWDSPGKNTGVGCHFLLQRMKVKSESEVAQSCPTRRDPMNCSPPGSSIRGIFQARVLEWETTHGLVYFTNAESQRCRDISTQGITKGSKGEPRISWVFAWKKSEVAQSCPTLYDPMDCSLSGSSIHEIFQARVLEWIAMSFSRGSSWSRNRTRVSRIADTLPSEPQGKLMSQ